MPELTARVADPNTTWGTLQWNLMITYNRLDREDTSNYRFTASEPTDEWYINPKFGTDIVGGKGILSCRLDTVYDCSTMFYFCIRAENPDEAIIENYIQNLSTSMWYTKYVAKHESGPPQNGRYYLQFNEVGDLGCSDDDIKHAPNRNPNPIDSGWGLFQLTKFGPEARAPNAQELWSWKANAISGSGYLHDKQHVSETYMITQCSMAFGIPVWYVASPVLFHDITDACDTTIDQAVALKRYNGLGLERDELCYFETATNEWVIVDSASYIDNKGDTVANYYVRDVCSLVIPW